MRIATLRELLLLESVYRCDNMADIENIVTM